jgi:pimeloyl-ACP methyl ester carboxylesterase
MQAALEGSLAQLARSWYIFAAQVPGLPELAARWTDYEILVRAMRGGARPGTFRARDFARYRGAWSRPGALTGMVNWYRAAARHPLRLPGARVRVPTLLMWGRRDQALGPELAPASAAMCDRVRLEYLPAAGHWLLHEEPARVNRLLLDFLSERE